MGCCVTWLDLGRFWMEFEILRTKNSHYFRIIINIGGFKMQVSDLGKSLKLYLI